APDVPGGYEGIRTVSGTPLALFGKTEPEVVGAIAAQTLKVGGGAVVVDVKDSFSDVDGDILGYSATSNMPGIASVSVTGSMVKITPVSAGSATVTVTASDQTNSATQEIDVIVKNTAPVVDKGLTDQIALSGNAFTYTFPADAFSDADSDVLTYTSSGQPVWLTFTSSSRTFSGTPSNTDGSSFTIIVTADDGKNSQVQTSFTLMIPIGICSRTSQVQTAILSVIDGINNCAHVTEEHLVGIVDSLDFRSRSITALLASDFSDLSNLRILNFYDNDLTSLPSGVFSGLSNLRFLSLYKNELTALPSGVFSGLSNLRVVSLDSNLVSTLPDNVFSGLSNLESLSLNGNTLSALPAGVFSGLSSLSHLDVSGNTGASFSLTLILGRTDNTDLTATGPATVVVKVAQGAPFDMTVELSATDGTLTDENGNAITEVTISKGNIQSEPITVTQSGTTSTTVSLGTAPSLPMNYVGIQIAVGTSLILFGQ
ncbi:MAG: putative Ig domain-containing protein, partial [Gemmatimonadota bacterium]|nr:putative Ig domain-containing protein [Gemmatimonadota bacterium]